VPETLHTSCDLLVLVNQSTESVRTSATPPDRRCPAGRRRSTARTPASRAWRTGRGHAEGLEDPDQAALLPHSGPPRSSRPSSSCTRSRPAATQDEEGSNVQIGPSVEIGPNAHGGSPAPTQPSGGSPEAPSGFDICRVRLAAAFSPTLRVGLTASSMDRLAPVPWEAARAEPAMQGGVGHGDRLAAKGTEGRRSGSRAPSPCLSGLPGRLPPPCRVPELVDPNRS